jgi:hypothetical protein
MTTSRPPARFTSGAWTPSRRHVLRGAGVALALPALSWSKAASAQASAPAKAGPPNGAAPPRRILAICNNLGLVPDKFFPAQAGRAYEPSPCLVHLQPHREDFTVLGGVSHPDVDGGHPADICFLTAAPHPSSGGFRNTVSLDQFAAQRIGHLTRFPSLTLGVNLDGAQRSLSWTTGGVLIPCEQRPSALFRRLFLRGKKDEVAAQIQRLELGGSVMDAVADQARSAEAGLGARDRERLEQYFTGVRDLEMRLQKAREWEDVPKPVVKVPAPEDPPSPRDYMRKTKLMYDLSRMAFETDSTRLITIMLDSVSSPAIDVEGAEIKDGYHNLSHHGKSEAKLAQLEAIDGAHMKLLDGLLTDIGQVTEGGARLLDRTMVLYGSNLGNANTHVTTNLPIIFAGGGFRHGQHLMFDRERNYPLPNLFVNMLQRLGIEADRFASSTGTMRGLELV